MGLQDGWMDGGGGERVGDGWRVRELVQKAFTTAQKTNEWGLKPVWRF